MHLQACLYPVQLRRLEELRGFEDLEKILLIHCLGRAPVQLVEHVALEQLLVRHSDLDRVRRRAMLVEPILHERDVDRAARVARAKVERPWRPHQRDAVASVVGVQRRLGKEWLDAVWQLKILRKSGLSPHHRTQFI